MKILYSGQLSLVNLFGVPLRRSCDLMPSCDFEASLSASGNRSALHYISISYTYDILPRVSLVILDHLRQVPLHIIA